MAKTTKKATKAPKAAKTSKTSKVAKKGTPVPPVPKKEPIFPKEKGRRYWLVKSEPNSRVDPKTGVDARFSIADLAHVDNEPWNGVRNYEARSNLLNMRPGDICLFYHSNCKNPGIVGIARVVTDAKPDELQFNPKSAYYDTKSTREEPRWWCPDVEFVCLLRRKLPLTELRSTPKFQDLYVVKRGRLSVTPVSPKDFHAVLDAQGTNEVANRDEEFDCDTKGLGSFDETLF